MDTRRHHEVQKGYIPTIAPTVIRKRDTLHGGGLVFRRFVWNVKAQRFLDAHDYGLKAWPIGKKG
jgi:hypothetical protein